MSRKTLSAALLALILAFLAGEAAARPEPADLKRLKRLAGDWSFVDPAGEPTRLRAHYRAVAGGSGVIETLFAGMPEETVTIYHGDGKALAATRLSSLGGTVRLVQAKAAEPGTLRFESDRDGREPGSLRTLRVTFLDREGVSVAWENDPGGGTAPASRLFTLRRETSLEELAAEASRLRADLNAFERELDRHLKTRVEVRWTEAPTVTLLETVTLPDGPGWRVAGVPFRRFLQAQSVPFASTYSAEGDKGMTVGHYGFKAGTGCTLRFSVLGGHGYIAVVEETRKPPRRIESIPEFAEKLSAGHYGPEIERIVGGHWSGLPRAVEWDLSKFAGKGLRLYVVDAVSNHYGQIAVSEIRIVEQAAR